MRLLSCMSDLTTGCALCQHRQSVWVTDRWADRTMARTRRWTARPSHDGRSSTDVDPPGQPAERINGLSKLWAGAASFAFGEVPVGRVKEGPGERDVRRRGHFTVDRPDGEGVRWRCRSPSGALGPAGTGRGRRRLGRCGPRSARSPLVPPGSGARLVGGHGEHGREGVEQAAGLTEPAPHLGGVVWVGGEESSHMCHVAGRVVGPCVSSAGGRCVRQNQESRSRGLPRSRRTPVSGPTGPTT